MFGNWRWGECVAGAREGFLFFFIRMLPSWHDRSGVWLLTSTDDGKQAAASFVLHTDTLSIEAAQVTPWAGSLCRPSCCCWPWSCSESGRISLCWCRATWRYHCYSSAVEAWWFLCVDYARTNSLAVLDSGWSNSSSDFWNRSYDSSDKCLYLTDLNIT